MLDLCCKKHLHPEKKIELIINHSLLIIYLIENKSQGIGKTYKIV